MPEPGPTRHRQIADLRLIEEAWNGLRPFLGVEKCIDCECLQAALTELVMALEGLAVGAERERLLMAVREGLDLSKLHGCLGCDSCEPADALASFYRARDAMAASAQRGCGPSCAERTCTP